MTTFYVSGKMRGIPKYNFPQFDSCSAWLRSCGYDVINPAQHDREVEPDLLTQEHYLKGDPSLSHGSLNFPDLIGWDLRMIASPECDAIVMLPGWEASEGARHERYVAEACQKQVWLAHPDYIVTEGGEQISPQIGWYITLDSNQRRLAGAKFGRVEGEDLERLERSSATIYRTTPEAWPHTVSAEPVRRSALQAEDPGQPSLASTVVGLVGYAQVGKDTLAAQLVEKHGFQRIAFADVLRECLYALNPMVGPWLREPTGSRLQDVIDYCGWDKAKTRFPEIRELLQRMGTEVGRNILGTDIWVETALKKVQPGGKYVITDVRFPNEFAAIEKLGGTTVRILREGYGPVNDHWSEKALDSYAADVTVWNSGTPEDLLRLAAKFLGLVSPFIKAGIPAPFGGRRALGVEA